MLKLKINLFVGEDGFNKPYPVTILYGNIKPDIPNGLPYCGDERVNFQYQTNGTYSDRSNKKVNTRFLYPYGGGYKKVGKEGYCAVYAKLKIWQRIILSFIAKTSIFHKHTKAVIFALINILGFIPMWIPFLFSPGEEFHKSLPTNQKQSVVNSKEVVDSSALTPIDSLQQKEKLK